MFRTACFTKSSGKHLLICILKVFYFNICILFTNILTLIMFPHEQPAMFLLIKVTFMSYHIRSFMSQMSILSTFSKTTVRYFILWGVFIRQMATVQTVSSCCSVLILLFIFVINPHTVLILINQTS